MKTRDKCWENDLEKYAENKLVFFNLCAKHKPAIILSQSTSYL